MPSKLLPPNANPGFGPDYPGAIVYPAHPTNYAHRPTMPVAICLHTPEEDADDTETTPVWFSQDHGDPEKAGSTTYYLDSDGDVYQCVAEDWMHFGNGLRGKPLPAWATPALNLNQQTLSIEIEGRAATIQDTMVIGGPQWLSLVALIRDRCVYYDIPMDREHIIGHYQVASDRTDPGRLFPWADLMTALAQEDDLTDEEKRKLDDRDGRVQLDNLLTRFYNVKTNREHGTILLYEPGSGVVKAVIPVPEWAET